MNRSNEKLLIIVSTIFMIVFASLFVMYQYMIATYITIGLWLVVYIFAIYHLRCPHFGMLPLHDIFLTRHCPMCGKKLDDEEG